MKRSHLHQLGILTLFCIGLLTGCSGEGDQATSTAPSPDITATPPAQDHSGEQPNGPSGQPNLIPFDYQARFANRHLAARQVVNTQFVNGTGTVLFPDDQRTYRGNLTVSLDAITDPDGVSRVLLGFENAQQAQVLCDGNCNDPFAFTETGVNPANFSQQPGSLQLQVWVEDNGGNLSTVATQQITWLPRSIAFNSTPRSDGTAALDWQPLPSFLRYNAYLAESPIDDVRTITTLPGGQRVIALTDSTHTFSGLDPQKHYYTRITGIDGSGESAFSESRMLAATNLITPIAVADRFSGVQFESVSGNLLSNDDANGLTPLTLITTAVRDPQNGTLTLFSDGRFTYVPRENFFGTDSFRYRIVNSQGVTAEAEVNLLIERVNQDPIAFDNRYALAQNSVLTVSGAGLLVNDIDFDGDTLTVNTTPVTDVQHGTLTLNSDGSFNYQPDPDFIGTDSFEYRVEDGNGGSNTATITLLIETEVSNFPPVAVNDNYQTNEDEQLFVEIPGVLENDSDADEDPLILSIIEQPTMGTLELSETGSFRYTPQQNSHGQDYFVYQIDDGSASVQAFALIEVIEVNDAPVANDDSIEVAQGQTISILVAANDLDIDGSLDLASLTLVEGPSHGSVSLSSDNSHFIYQSEADYRGSDSFTYQIEDDQGATSNIANVFIEVTGDNNAPVATDDSAVTQQDMSVTIDVLANDSDSDGSLNYNSLTVITAPTNGNVALDTVELSGFIYTPQSGFSGSDSFTYQVQDNEGGLSNTATVTITVEQLNQPPVAVNDSATTTQEVPVTIDVLANDSDSDGSLNYSSLTVITAPTNGNVTLDTAEQSGFIYTPQSGFSGSDFFTYQVQDNEGGLSNTATVTVTVERLNQAPVAGNDSASVEIAQSVTITVLDNDSDADGSVQADTVEIVQSPQMGTAEISSSGTIIYTHTGTSEGEDSFTYRVQDNLGAHSNTATVTVTITAPDTTPVAVDDSAQTDKNVAVGISILNNDQAKGRDLLINSIMVVIEPSHGSVSIDSANGTALYIPQFNFVGSDSFGYVVSNDLAETSNIATVTITVNDKNYAPSVEPGSAEIDTSISNGEQVLLISASDPDGDTLAYQLSGTNAALFSVDSAGAVTVADADQLASNGEQTYVLTVTVCDSGTPQLCAESEISIFVTQAEPSYVATKRSEFGDDGSLMVVLNASQEFHTPGQTLLQADGKIISVGSVGHFNVSADRNIHRVYVSRQLSNGHPDRSFADYGNFQSNFDIEIEAIVQDVWATTAAIDEQGRIYVAGYVNFSSSQQLLVFRLLGDGSLDTSYANGNGYMTLPLGSNVFVTPVAIALEDNETITVLSNIRATSGATTGTVTLSRITAQGEVSVTQTLAQTPSKNARGMITLPSGDYLVYGEITATETGQDVMLVRLTQSTLTPDSSFQNNGLLQLNITPVDSELPGTLYNDTARQVVLKDSNTLLVTGLTTYDPIEELRSVYVLQLTTDGVLDTAFAGSGLRTYPVSELPSDSAVDLTFHSASGQSLVADGDSYYVALNRTDGTDEQVVQIIKVDLSGAIDTDWLPGSNGFSIYHAAGLKLTHMLQTQSGLLLSGQKSKLLSTDTVTHQWLAEVATSAEFNQSFASFGQRLVSVGRRDEAFSTGATSHFSASMGHLLLGGQATTWHTAPQTIPYVLKLDTTAQRTSTFGNLGLTSTLPSTSMGPMSSATVGAVNEDSSGAVILSASGNVSISAGDEQAMATVNKFSNLGTLDTSFANNGVLTLPASEYKSDASSLDITQLTPLVSGDLLALGQAMTDCYTHSMAFVISSSGTLSSFFEYTIPGAPSCSPNAHKVSMIHTAGSALVGVGQSQPGPTPPVLLLAKASATGIPDTSFGTDGLALLDIGLSVGDDITLKGSVVDASQGFIVFGYAGSTNFVVRVTSSGALDTSFADGGVLKFEQLSGEAVLLHQAWIDSQGKLLLFAQASGSKSLYVGQLLLSESPGSWDTSFDEDGSQLFSSAVSGELKTVLQQSSSTDFVFVIQQSSPARVSLQAGQIVQQ
ncbi:Ig-like domain-containing protein [Pseudoalteromonas sp. OOF1S-7]|uniref:Ig-like domain-containing protein n=1 Tax=Pseudoalteromonas sp. OOF1S-7 TaxID=2917757 RepID=UPI001EF65030|nr:Ig-like domain-containing protein [Pseudoalteromonas sp. OOF1S-7]MCG7536083.1 Ig-like domain-containing protein [Pseudoalteromonas sp. OOF1S-7]